MQNNGFFPFPRFTNQLRQMAVFTLTTDFGLKDHYAGSVKGQMIRQFPGATIIDISHLVPPGDIMQGSFILKNAWKEFPEGSIHIVAVGSISGITSPHIGAYHEGHYFIGCDNGLFSLLFDRFPEKVVELNLKQDTDNFTFPARDLYVKAAAHLARGGTLEVIGTPRSEFVQKNFIRHPPEQLRLKGTIIYVDSFGNLITDISKKVFRENGKGRNFTINLIKTELDRISEKYNDVSDGEIVAFFNSSGLLEIAVNKGKASALIGLKTNDVVRIEFYGDKNS